MRSSDGHLIIDILIEHAQSTPDKVAYRYLVDGDFNKEQNMTYGQLYRRVVSIASVLDHELSPGDRVLLLYPPGLEFICSFYACLYSGMIAVAAYPPNPHRLASSLARLEVMVRDATPSLVLGDAKILTLLKVTRIKDSILSVIKRRNSSCSNTLILNGIKKINSEKIRAESALLPYPSKSDDVAYLQYTSGSTGEPKGVMITNYNIMENTEAIARRVLRHVDSIVNWLPLYHDMGLVNVLFMPIIYDKEAILFSPLDFIKNPALWLKIISRVGGCYSGGPNFAYSYLLRKVSDIDLDGVDLSNWKIAFCGAESICHDSMELFFKGFSKYGFNKSYFYPCYGLAEVTVAATGRNMADDDGPEDIHILQREDLDEIDSCNSSYDKNSNVYVSCGYVVDDHHLIITDPEELQQLQDGEFGEIWFSGPSVAKGYWGNEKASKETFNAYTQEGEGPYLRTGDLGFLKDGELYIVGRLKDMIIIRGRNYAPQDIEYCVEVSHPAIRKGCVAAFGFDSDNVECMGVVCEIRKEYFKCDHEEIIQSIQIEIAEEVSLSVSAIVLLKPGHINKTTSGKIQRKACKEHFLSGKFDALKVWRSGDNGFDEAFDLLTSEDKFEQLKLKILVAFAREANVAIEMIDQSKSIFSLGVSSLQFVRLLSQLEKTHQITIDLDEITRNESLSELITLLANYVLERNLSSGSEDEMKVIS